MTSRWPYRIIERWPLVNFSFHYLLGMISENEKSWKGGPVASKQHKRWVQIAHECARARHAVKLEWNMIISNVVPNAEHVHAMQMNECQREHSMLHLLVPLECKMEYVQSSSLNLHSSLCCQLSALYLV